MSYLINESVTEVIVEQPLASPGSAKIYLIDIFTAASNLAKLNDKEELALMAFCIYVLYICTVHLYMKI